jgi:glycosyltransferase involved in cell wall biosynthesis
LFINKLPDLIHVEPQRSFFFYDWTGEGIRGIFEKSRPNLDEVYSIHLWSHRWWDRNRIDTSYFHAGRLSPEYLRFSKSAYAELARPFLPESMPYSRLRFKLQKIKTVWENGDFASRKYLGKIYRGDCFISLGRGEGWGMGSYEAAWRGKPIIITGLGGVLDYLPENLSYRVSYGLIPVCCEKGGQSYTLDQLWAEPDLAHARQLMRQVFEDQQGAAEKGMQLRDYVTHNFNSALIAQRCLDSLEH